MELDVEIRALGSDLGADVSQETDETQAWPGFFLYRASWRTNRSDASVGIQWSRGRVLLVDSALPYVGLRCRGDTPLAAAVKADPLFKEERRLQKAASLNQWPAYSYVPVSADDPFPDPSDAYRASLLDALRRAWNGYAPAVDRALTPLAGEGAHG
jgi:hypothetical protein